MSTKYITIRIVEWNNPDQLDRGTKLVSRTDKPGMERPAKNDTLTMGGEHYTVLDVNHDLDVGKVYVTVMLTENINGSGIEDL